MVRRASQATILGITGVIAVLLACSTSRPSGPGGAEGGAPGEAFTACQIQGYTSELDGGSCPLGTCSVLAFDTNGGRLPCCTSILSGPGRCVDAALVDAEVAPGDDASDEVDAQDASATTMDAQDAPTDAPASADAASDVTEPGTPDDASEGG